MCIRDGGARLIWSRCSHLLTVLQAHSASAREVRRIAMEALEALFGLQLPLPPSTVRQYMQGIAAMMTRCVHVPCSVCVS